MRNIIYKYKMKLGPNEHALPIGAHVLHFDHDIKTKSLCAWIEHIPTEDLPQMTMQRFMVIGTGMEYETALWKHVGTVLTGDFVWHLLTEKIPGTGATIAKVEERSDSVRYEFSAQ